MYYDIYKIKYKVSELFIMDHQIYNNLNLCIRGYFKNLM